MTVMWATRTSNTQSMVELWIYGKPERRILYRGSITTLEGSATVFHTVRLTGLHLGTKYSYRVGDAYIDTWCREYWFETIPRNPVQTRFAAVGDLDLDQDGTRRNLEFLKENIDLYDVLILLGDLCYKEGENWDEIGEALEPIASIRPLMVLPGNHEHDSTFGFHSFNTRFRMPDNGYLNQWYSFNLGRVHFVSLSTEDPVDKDSEQGKWLIRDLKDATERNDWTIMLAHRAVLASADKKWLVPKKAGKLKADLDFFTSTFKIQLALFGHIHLYERTHPINDVTYMTIGVGGARLDTEFNYPPPTWSAFRHAEHGACFFSIDHTQHTLSMEYKSAYDARVIDEMTMPIVHPES